jgi:hypothetical protein
MGQTGYGKVRGQTFTLRAPLNCIALTALQTTLDLDVEPCFLTDRAPLRYASLGR